MKKIAAMIGMITMAAAAHADTFTVSAEFDNSMPAYLEAGVPQNATIDFNTAFKSIERICFTAHFAGDLADPGESFMMGPFGNSSYGWINGGSVSNSSRMVCITSSHSGAEEFMDGEQTFGVRMSGGTATLTNLEVTVTGVASEAPTHDVDVELGEGAGTLPAQGGTVPYAVTFRNLDYELGYLDLQKWSVLTLPTGEDYPVHKPNDLQLSAGEETVYANPRLTIPAWFPAGEYTYTWYLANPLNEKMPIEQDSVTFEKLAQ